MRAVRLGQLLILINEIRFALTCQALVLSGLGYSGGFQ